MGANKDVSIIIPMYNAETSISKCLDSILDIEHKNIEIIIIDDGSTDKSYDICKTIAEKNKQIILIHQDNQGVSSARNSGIDKAQGKWITFIDSDDTIINSELLDRIIEYEQDLVIFQHLIYSKSDEKIQDNPFPTENCDNINKLRNYLAQHLSHMSIRAPWGKFLKKDIIGEIRFKDTIRIGEDTDFMFRYLSRCSSLLVVNKPFYIWSEPESNFSLKYPLNIPDAITHIQEIYNSYKLLDIRSVKTEKFIYQFFRSICDADIKKRPYLWFGNEFIWSYWETIHSYFPKSQHIKHLVLYLLSKHFRYLLNKI